MDAAGINDLAWRGLGAAARAVGEIHDLHRADGAGPPVRPATVRMLLPAHFLQQRVAASLHGHVLYEGVFDASYSRAGDYLTRPPATFFVLSQMPLQPILCARANRVITLMRAPPGQQGSGLGSYGGLVRGQTLPLLTGWPASVIDAGSGLDRAGLPGDAGLGGMSVLLPASGGVVLRTGDLLTDDLGRAGVVMQAELSDHGWRLLVRQAAS